MGVFERDHDARGFRRFLVRARSGEEILYGAPGDVMVHESSLAGRGPHVRITDPIGGVQLNLDEAAEVRDALDVFIAEATAGELTEKPL